MNHQPLDEQYLKWLYSLVADPNITDPDLCYWQLVTQLFKTEFVWAIPADENRSEDGKELRLEFLESAGIHNADRDWIEIGCSALELMVGLSRRLSFEAEGEPHYWFWTLMDNIGISQYNDGYRRYPAARVDEALHRVIYREYDGNGRGGFFPLKHADQDQRRVELWYQLGAYVLEQED